MIARSPGELETAERAVAIGTFDGVHRGHRAVIEATRSTGLRTCVVTFDPHPRKVLGYGVELLATFERRLELIEAAGPDDVFVVAFTPETAQLEPEDFVEATLIPIGTRVVVAGEDFRFGRRRRGDPHLLRSLGIDVRPVPLVEGVSSSRIRELLRAGDVPGAALLLGRPAELEGIVVSGDQRGGTLGFPTANLAVDADLLVPRFGIYAGAGGVALDRARGGVVGESGGVGLDRARGGVVGESGGVGLDRARGGVVGEMFRAGISVGVNPHYGGTERRIEAFLLDFSGDLYGERLRLELWQRLRDERAFVSEEALVEQIAHDVEAAREAQRPV